MTKTISFLFTIYLIVSTSEARGNMSSEDAARQTVEVLLRGDSVSLKTRLACSSSPYRTFDGSCNNLNNPTLGMANTPLIRLPGLRSPTAYEGNNFAPRRLSKSGNNVPLPNARKVSVKVFVAGEGSSRFKQPTRRGTHLVMTWGQFLDHDVTLTELTEDVNCGTNGAPCPNKADCIGIDVDRSVSLNGDQSVKCIPLTRSARNQQGEQTNMITHFIDGSQVYGSCSKIAEELRDRNANLGLMDVRPFVTSGAGSSPILPPEEEGFCRSKNKEEEPCVRAGDVRSNENQALTAMHTVWVREHNRVALILHTLNPTWDDERLFQEARKIVIAEIQHITYNEWLPMFFTKKTRIAKGLLLEPRGKFFTGYKPGVSPAIFNSFSTAALRMGHSLVRGDFRLPVFGVRRRRQPELDVSDFFNPSPLYEPIRGQNPYGLIIRGLRLDSMRRVDHIFSPAVRERLILEGPGDGLLGDLTAINLQRGRDHGLPPYVKFVEACGKTIETFNDLCQVMSRKSRDRLKTAYRSVLDIDLFAGAMNEFPWHGSAVGFTFRCILTQQFRNLRLGDRFWYERKDQKVGFTLKQLDQIRKVTMARVLCNNVDGYTWSQPRAFALPNRLWNKFRPCFRIPAMDLTPFKEESAMADESNEAEDAAVVEADTALTEDEPEKHIEDLKASMADGSNEAEDAAVIEADTALTDDEPEMDQILDEPEVAFTPDKPEVEQILGEPELALTPDEAEAALFDDAVST